MNGCRNCKHFDTKIKGKQFINLGFCKWFNLTVPSKNSGCIRFEQKRYFEVTRSEQE